MKSLITYTILLLVITSSIHAQSVNDSIIQAKADSMIYYYARYGAFTEDDRSISKRYIRNFKELFSGKAAVYNDIVPDLYSMDLLSLDEYITGASEKFPSGITITISKKEYGTMKEIPEKERGIIEVKAEKEVLGMTIDDDFYEKNFDITFIISFDKDLSNFKIMGIRKLRIENRSITLQVIKDSDGSQIKGVKINMFFNNELHQTKISDYEGKVIFSEIPPKSLVTVVVDEDEDYVTEEKPGIAIEKWIEGKEGQRRILLSRVKEWTKFSLEVFGTPSMTHVKSENTTNNYSIGSFANDSKFGYGLGVGVSYAVYYDKKIAISIGTGVGLDTYNSNVIFNGYNQNANNEKDSEGDAYELYVLSNQITDNITLSYISIPLKVNFRKYFEKKFIDYFFASVGANYGYLIDNSSVIAGTGTFYGHYQTIGDKIVNIDIHNVPELDFTDDGNLAQTNEMQVNTMNLSAIASFGVSIPIVKDILNFDIAANINYGFSNISSYNYQDYYFAKEGYGMPIKTSLIGSGSKVNTLAYGARIGLTYNVFK